MSDVHTKGERDEKLLGGDDKKKIHDSEIELMIAGHKNVIIKLAFAILFRSPFSHSTSTPDGLLWKVLAVRLSLYRA